METIAVDLMGGDNAPQEIAKGALDAAAEMDVTVALVGTKEALEEHLGSGGGDASRWSYRVWSTPRVVPVEASQVIGTAEQPTAAWREKKDSSIAIGIGMVQEGRADAFVSAGNTGAIATISLLSLRSMKGIERPAIATLYTTLASTVCMILDVGANVDCRPKYLLQFGEMGSTYMSKVFRLDSPRVGLLSNGEEEMKGTKLVREAHKLLKESGLNFIGNVEGFDVLQGAADVIVTDGFTGNVVLKLAESLAGSIFLSLKDALGNNVWARASKALWGPPVMSVARQWDYSGVSGAPLLGVAGNIVMAHGRSSAADITRAIALAQRMVQEGWYLPPVGKESEERIAASNDSESG